MSETKPRALSLIVLTYEVDPAPPLNLAILDEPKPNMNSLIVLTYEVDPAPPLDLAILDEPKPNHDLSHSAHL